jgi:hypothetical protein
MKTLLRTLVPLFFVLAILGSSRKAHALGPIGIEAGAQVGYGTNPDSSFQNPLGVGLGLRAGVVLFGGLYGGVKITDYLGSNQDGLKFHSLQEGIDVGWGFKILLLTIRPQIGIGNIGFTESGTESVTVAGVTASTSANASQSSLYLEPGVTALISLGLIYIGADINYLYVTSYPDGVNSTGVSTKGAGGATIHGQIGVQF